MSMAFSVTASALDVIKVVALYNLYYLRLENKVISRIVGMIVIALGGLHSPLLNERLDDITTHTQSLRNSRPAVRGKR